MYKRQTRPSIDPKNIFLIERRPRVFIIVSSNHAIKVIKATANITPGIAYPEIDRVDNKFKILLFETLFP